jgi:hypothetical protein
MFANCCSVIFKSCSKKILKIFSLFFFINWCGVGCGADYFSRQEGVISKYGTSIDDEKF